MSKTARLRLSDLRAIYHLVGECCDVGDDPAAWWRHCLASLARLTDADLAIGGEQAGLVSGQYRVLSTNEVGWENGFDRRGMLRAFELLGTGSAYVPLAIVYAQRRGGRGALRRCALVDDRAWRRSIEYNEVLRVARADHPLYCFRPVPGAGDEVAGVAMNRAAGRPDFTARDAAVVTEAFAVLGPLVGRALARHSEPSPAALPPRVRQVLRCLLEGDGDKQVAKRLGISAYTVNQYVKVIFAHFGVQSRTELLARWVRRGWGNGFAWADPDVE